MEAVTQFLDIALAFPTVVYSLFLGLVVVYWCFVLIGAADVELLDVSGVLEGVDGALDGAADAAVDGALEGATDGALDGAADGVGDADLVQAGVGRGALAWVASIFRLGEVPLTITLSVLTLYGWLVCYLAVRFLGWDGALGLVVLFGTFAVTLFPTSWTVRPLGNIFKTHTGLTNHQLIGKTCVIRTPDVDGTFGQAEYFGSGVSLLLSVRCDQKNQLTRGDEALIVTYDEGREAFVIEPLAKKETA